MPLIGLVKARQQEIIKQPLKTNAKKNLTTLAEDLKL